MALAESEPYFVLEDRIPETSLRDRREKCLSSGATVAPYLSALSENTGAVTQMSSPVEHPVLSGLRGNLYMSFMERSWRSQAAAGVVGLVHPDSHFSDPKAQQLRGATYARLRRHWQFANELKLFEDVDNHTSYAIHIYGEPRGIRFLQCSGLLTPETLEDSMNHDGTGEIPGTQFAWGGWDLRPHKNRIVTIDEHVLRSWADLFDEPGTNPLHARLLRPLTTDHLLGLVQISSVPERLGELGYHWTQCWNEKTDKTKGTIKWDTRRVESLDEVILQGPLFGVATPYVKEPNLPCRSNKDYSGIDLVDLPENFIPRTNYQRACDRATYTARVPKWDERKSTTYWRLAWRQMTQSGLERTLIAALMPPGPAHIHSVCTLAMKSNLETALVSGLWSSIPFDYMLRVCGAANVNSAVIDRFPTPLDHVARSSLLLRALRLNCVTKDYAGLWEELFETAFRHDYWTSSYSDWPNLGSVENSWTKDTPLRNEFERRAALVEIDALAAIMLGVDADQLTTMYIGQFGVLRKYEYTTWFDNRGDKIAKEFHAKGLKQQDDDYRLLMAYNEGETCGDLLERFEPPFIKADRESEMRAAHAEFTERLGL